MSSRKGRWKRCAAPAAGSVNWCRHMLVVFVLLSLAPGTVRAHGEGTNADAMLNAVGFEQRLNAQVPLDLTFRAESGQPVALNELIRDKPVLLVLSYFYCSSLCPLVLEEVATGLADIPFNIGTEFDVITVSINPHETPPLAAQTKATYVAKYGRPGAAAGWHFLTGQHESIDRLAEAIGFRYAYDSETQQYAHAAGFVLLTPAGRISRYFYGLEYRARDVRLGLVEASAGWISSPVDQLLLRCYHYDPATGTYTVMVQRIMQIAGAATLLFLGGLITVLYRQEKKHHAIPTIS